MTLLHIDLYDWNRRELEISAKQQVTPLGPAIEMFAGGIGRMICRTGDLYSRVTYG